LVTGSRSGLGFEIAKSLLGQGATVIIASRSLARNTQAVQSLKDEFGSDANISFMTFDLELLDSVREFCKDFKENHDRLDYLFLNAASSGFLSDIQWINDGNTRVPTPITSDGYDSIFQAVYIGQVLIAESLRPLLRDTDGPSRVIMTSSSTHAAACPLLVGPVGNNECFDDDSTSLDMLPLTDPDASEGTGYPIGKYLILQMVKEWKTRYSGDDIHAYSWAPGNILTALNSGASPNTGNLTFDNTLFFLPYVGPINVATGMPVLDVPPQFTFFNSPAHGAKAAIYQALMAPEEDAGSFVASYWECEVNKGAFMQGMTEERRSAIYDASLKWAGLTEDDNGDGGDGDKQDEPSNVDTGNATGNEDENGDGGDGTNQDDPSNNEDEPSSVDTGTTTGVEDSIVDLVCDRDSPTLCAVVKACIDSFDADEIYTVFAPTDEAFEALAEEVGGLNTVDDDTLCGILQYHVVAGKAIYSKGVSCESGPATLVEMMNGVNTRIKCTNGMPYGIKGGGNDEPVNFVEVDIEASDGVIHVIDGVLL